MGEQNVVGRDFGLEPRLFAGKEPLVVDKGRKPFSPALSCIIDAPVAENYLFND